MPEKNLPRPEVAPLKLLLDGNGVGLLGHLDEASRAMWTVRRTSRDEADSADLIAMLGLDRADAVLVDRGIAGLSAAERPSVRRQVRGSRVRIDVSCGSEARFEVLHCAESCDNTPEVVSGYVDREVFHPFDEPGNTSAV